MIYIMDTNALIEASSRYYKKCICPGFWDWLVNEQNKSVLKSIDFINKEISKKDDYLKQWAASNKEFFLLSDSQTIQEVFPIVAQHVMTHEVYSQEEKSRFLDGADPWLITHAMVQGYTIVTHEKLVPDNSRKVKIPNVCKTFGVQHCDTFELLEELQATFVLENKNLL